MEHSSSTLWAMLLFSLCSSSLLLVNKLCMHMAPAPSFISTLQFVTAGSTCLVIKATGLAIVDDFEWEKVKPYLLYVCMFCSTIYCNMKSLEHSNVETIIVFRACCPLCVCLFDWAFLGRELPSVPAPAPPCFRTLRRMQSPTVCLPAVGRGARSARCSC